MGGSSRDRDKVIDLYVVRSRSVPAIAAVTGYTPRHVRRLLREAGVTPPRAYRRVLDDDQVSDLRVRQGLAIKAIARQLGVSPAAIRRSLRRTGHPVSAPVPAAARPAITREEFVEQYVVHERSLDDIARELGTSLRQVSLLRAQLGVRRLPRKRPRPSDLRKRYEQLGSVAALGEHYQITRTTARIWLQEAGVAIRNPQNPGSDHRPVLDELYSDPAIQQLCERHQLPYRPQHGRRSVRFPVPAPLTADLLRDGYLEVGLAVSHLSLLTGQHGIFIRKELRRHDIALRGTGRSPWSERRARMNSALVAAQRTAAATPPAAHPPA